MTMRLIASATSVRSREKEPPRHGMRTAQDCPHVSIVDILCGFLRNCISLSSYTKLRKPASAGVGHEKIPRINSVSDNDNT